MIQFNPKTGRRGIEWCDETRNVFGGCFHRCRWLMPDGSMAMCYAEDLAENGLARAGYPHGFEHHYWRANLNALVKGSVPRLIFMDSMSDMFGHWVPEEQLQQVLQVMRQAPHHTYQCLTKAPGRLQKFMALFPKNLWVGVSSPPDFLMPDNGRATDAFDGLDMKPAHPMPRHAKGRYMQKTLNALREVKQETGNTVWMSLEPVSWDMADYIDPSHPLDWVVMGAATRGAKKYQPDPGHIKKLLQLFDETGTPVFFKGNIRPLFKQHDFGSQRLNQWREDFPIGAAGPAPAVIRRQEMAQEHGWTLNTHLQSGVPVGTAVQMSFFGS